MMKLAYKFESRKPGEWLYQTRIYGVNDGENFVSFVSRPFMASPESIDSIMQKVQTLAFSFYPNGVDGKALNDILPE